MARRRMKKRANPKNMRKTTGRGAYKPARKRQMAIRRAPIVECKKDERYDWNGLTYHNYTGGPITSAWLNRLAFRDLEVGDVVPAANNLPNQVSVHMPDTFIYRTQGFGKSEMVGNSVFIKYLKAKVEIKLPEDEGLIHFPQCQMYFVHGFVNKSIDANEFTTPSLANLTRVQYREFIADQVDKYFTNANEPMRYQPKGRINSAITILGKREIKWNKSKSILPDPRRIRVTATEDATLGSLPTKIVHCKWPMMRKVKYELLPQATNTAVDTPFTRASNYFVNHQNAEHGFPFWAVYVPGGANIIYSNPVNRIQIRDNDVCYFTDS